MSEAGGIATSQRVLIPLSLSRASFRQQPKGKFLTRIGGTTMGTSWSVVCARPLALNEGVIRNAVEAELARIIREMSNWETGSHISRFNRSRPGSRHLLPEDFARVLACALQVARETEGAYDPTIAPLVALWGFGPDGRRMAPPSPEEIAAGVSRVGWQKLVFDAGARMLTQPGGVSLDFSSIAKGYAVDCVARCLDALGVAHHLVEIGGELRGRGVKPDGSPWWVEVDIPSANGRTLVALHGLSIATSGAERSIVHDGRAYSHTVDPRSGMALSNSLSAVTVLHPDCMWADAYATALMVLGKDEGLAFASAKNLAAIFVHEGGECMTPAFRAMLD